MCIHTLNTYTLHCSCAHTHIHTRIGQRGPCSRAWLATTPPITASATFPTSAPNIQSFPPGPLPLPFRPLPRPRPFCVPRRLNLFPCLSCLLLLALFRSLAHSLALSRSLFLALFLSLSVSLSFVPALLCADLCCGTWLLYKCV